jgi:hypothetical protein
VIKEFFSLITGKKKRTYHRSNFPGIKLPEGYDPMEWKEKVRQQEHPEFLREDGTTRRNEKNIPEITQEDITRDQEKRRHRRKKKSLLEMLEIYLKNRELRKEERTKKRLRREHKLKVEREMRRRHREQSKKKKIFNFTNEFDDFDPDAKPALFSHRSLFYKQLVTVVNSTMIFILSYILVYLFYWITCVLVASVYNLDSILYYYDLRFNDHSPLWNRLNILMVTGIPPALCLILAVFLFQVAFKSKKFVGLQKLFILWSTFHLFNHFFGAFPSGIVTDEGLGYVAAWLYLNTAFKFLLSLVSIFTLGAIGFYSAKYILETADSYQRIKGDNRLRFIFFQMALPWFIGTIALLLLRMPENFNYPYETLMLFSTIFMVAPAFFNEKVKPELNLMKVKKRIRINFGYLAMLLIMAVFLRWMLGIGLHFIIEINVSISPATGIT